MDRMRRVESVSESVEAGRPGARMSWAARGAGRFILGVASGALIALAVGAPTPAMAAGVRVENVESPFPDGLQDQQTQSVTFAKPVTASLVTIADLGGAGRRSFLVTLHLSGGGVVSIQGKEDQPDVIMSLAESLPITGVSIRCDSFSAVNCRYSLSVVGK